MRDNQRSVLILGSTGSIGTNALEVIRSLPGRFRVAGLSAGSNTTKLCEQVREFRPPFAAVADGYGDKDAIGERFRELDCELHFGQNGLCRLVERAEADIVVGAISGWAGFLPCLKALETGCRLALANKETLVVGGQIVRETMQRCGSTIVPVDSEESAIFQAMHSGRRSEVRRIFLTASGGPFRDWPAERLRDVTPEQALQHPNWSMGRKIAIDCATMINKALEIVETRWLFDIEPDRIEVLLHPQSIVHSMVEFDDASIMAQLGAADMKVPIQYALTYPERTSGPGKRLDFDEITGLDLRMAGEDEFPALKLGYYVAEAGGTSGAVLNAASEVFVDAFLSGRIGFTDIVGGIGRVLFQHKNGPGGGFEELVQADILARQEAEKCLTRL